MRGERFCLLSSLRSLLARPLLLGAAAPRLLLYARAQHASCLIRPLCTMLRLTVPLRCALLALARSLRSVGSRRLLTGGAAAATNGGRRTHEDDASASAQGVQRRRRASREQRTPHHCSSAARHEQSSSDRQQRQRTCRAEWRPQSRRRRAPRATSHARCGPARATTVPRSAICLDAAGLPAGVQLQRGEDCRQHEEITGIRSLLPVSRSPFSVRSAHVLVCFSGSRIQPR